MAGGNSRRREMRHGPESAAWGPRVRVRPGLAGIFQKEEENADVTAKPPEAAQGPRAPAALGQQEDVQGKARDCE